MGTLGMRKCGVPSKGDFHYLAAWKRFVGRTFCWAATCQKIPAKAPGKPFPTACAAKAQMLLCRSPFGEGKYLFCKICLHCRAARTNFGEGVHGGVKPCLPICAGRRMHSSAYVPRRAAALGADMPAGKTPTPSPANFARGLCRY